MIFFSLLQVIGLVTFYGMLKLSTRRGCLTVMPTHSKCVESCSLRVPFPLHHWGILCDALVDHVDGKQQRTAHPTCNCCDRSLGHDPSRWYTFHLAPWISVACTQLHVSDDHVYHHVNWHGGFIIRQPGIPMVAKPVESGEEDEDEEGRRVRGPWRSQCVVHIRSVDCFLGCQVWCECMCIVFVNQRSVHFCWRAGFYTRVWL